LWFVGRRALLVTNALIACFVATAFCAPGVRPLRSIAAPLNWRSGACAMAFAVMLLILGPAISREQMSGEAATNASVSPARADEFIIPAGRLITGYQVIPDGSPRPLNIPTLFASEFAHLARMIEIEVDFGPFLDVALRRVPFVLVVTGRFDNVDQSNILLAPVTLLEQQSGVAAWRLRVRQGVPGGKPWTTLREVLTVEPIPARMRN
jgi:hypothetical protein